MKVLRLAAVALAALLTACSPAKQEQARKAPDGRTTIRFATDWRAQAEQGGFYQAVATGEYAKRGLDVQIVQGGPGVNVPQLLASGAVEAGMGSNSFIVMNLAKENIPVKAVAAMMQKDPQVLIAHPGQGLEKIADLKGRPILLSDASVTAFWVWLKSKYGFTDSQVRKYTFNAAPGDALIRKDNPEMTQDVLDQAREKLRSYGIVDSGDAQTGGIGVMSDARWTEFFNVAASQGVYPTDMDFKKAYTLQFVAPAAK